MRLLSISIHAALAGTILVAASAVAQSARGPSEPIPSRNSETLEQLLSLDDERFRQSIAASNGQQFRNTVGAFDPPETPIFPVPLSFAGLRNECLSESSPFACRLYLVELIKIHRGRAGINNGNNSVGR